MTGLSIREINFFARLDLVNFKVADCLAARGAQPGHATTVNLLIWPFALVNGIPVKKKVNKNLQFINRDIKNLKQSKPVASKQI